MSERTSFQTTGPAGLDHDSLPMRLYHKAKRLGVWPLVVRNSVTGDEWTR